MLTIRLDSTRIARFILRKVESTHRKSICERLRKNKKKRLSTLGRVENVDDSTRIARFVLRKVESTHRKSICERLKKKKGKKAINIREGRKCRRFDSIRLESRDSSCVKSNRLTGSRFARDLEKIKQEGYEH